MRSLLASSLVDRLSGQNRIVWGLFPDGRLHGRSCKRSKLAVPRTVTTSKARLARAAPSRQRYPGLLCLSPLNDLGRRDNIRPLSEQAIEKTGVQFRVARASVTDNQNTVVLVHRLQCRREHNAAGDDPEQNERVYVFRPEQNLQVSTFKSADAGLCNDCFFRTRLQAGCRLSDSVFSR